jgi:hypothetical protein
MFDRSFDILWTLVAAIDMGKSTLRQVGAPNATAVKMAPKRVVIKAADRMMGKMNEEGCVLSNICEAESLFYIKPCAAVRSRGGGLD